MKLTKKLAIATLSMSMLSVSLSPTLVQASSSSDISNAHHKMYTSDLSINNSVAISKDNLNTDFLTKYVSVLDNQFVLNIPENAQLSMDVHNRALSELAVTNSFVKENNLTINPDTLIAETTFANGHIQSGDFSVAAYGKTGILKVGWNYVKVGLNAGLTKDVLTAGVAGAAGYLGFLVSGPGAAAVVAAVSGVVGNHVNVKNGVWFTYNIVSRKVTSAGWQ